MPDVNPADVAEFEALSSQSAFRTFLAAAQAIEGHAVERCGASPVLAYHNVRRAVEDVLTPHEATIAALPDVRVDELRALPELARGLAFAALLVHYDLEAASFGALYAQARKLREKLVAAARALVESGQLPRAFLEPITGEGQGRRDCIEDVGGLASLFRRQAVKLAGHSPLADADLAEAETVSAKLESLLAFRDDDGGLHRLPPAVELRNRFWTLLNQRYLVLWRAAALIYGRDVDLYVPPLEPRQQARLRTRRSLPSFGVAGSAVRFSSEPQKTALRRYAESRQKSADTQAPVDLAKSKFRFWIQVGVNDT